MSKKSYFIDKDQKGPFTRSAAPVEADNLSALVDNLLSEFEHSSEAEKSKYRPILMDWLGSMDESTLFQEDERKVRDFIYEMF